MTQEAFGQEFDWFFFFSALIYPYLSRKWSDTFTYKIMKDLFEFPQEM
jgi:nuclear transport factor 2 (NTF2) superfamily protein